MKIPVRIEDLPVVASFVSESVSRDLAHFTEYSPKFGEDWLNDFNAKTNDAGAVVAGKIFTKELVKTTADLNEAMAGLRLLLNRLEGYVKLAGNRLSTTVAGFGVSAVRKPLNKGNVEGTIKAAADLLHNIETNVAALSEQGLNNNTLHSFREACDSIGQLNRAQNRLISQRAIAVEDNAAVFGTLWTTLNEALTAGRSMYKGVDAARLKDYTVVELKKRVNAEQSASGKKVSQL